MDNIKQRWINRRRILKQYKPSDYERPSVTVDMLILCMSKYLKI